MTDQRRYWDEQAASFDEEPDHGLRDPHVRHAWSALLTELLPDAPARVADLGCGTATLSVLLAQLGHRVSGVDLAPKMIERARRKARAAAVTVDLRVGDVSAPSLQAGAFDVVLARHVLWALPDPAVSLGRWIELLNGRGRLVLIEGRWATGAGLTASETVRLVRERGRQAVSRPLTSPGLWGTETGDERYVVVSTDTP